MTWLDHPLFIPTRDRVVKAFRKKAFVFRHNKPALFLCGGSNSQNRERLAEYLRKNHTNVLVFYAEQAWKIIAAAPDSNALHMEAQLGKIADVICVLVESAGTQAELGAFALHPKLRRKLLAIVDSMYQDAESFINTGPLRWIDRDSMYGPTVWTDTSVILECVNTLNDRLEKLVTGPLQSKANEIAETDKHLLFLMCDLISVFWPSDIEQLHFYLSQIVPPIKTIQISYLAALAHAMDLVETREVASKVYFVRRMASDHFPSLQVSKYYWLPGLRAEVYGTLVRIPTCRVLLEQISQTR